MDQRRCNYPHWIHEASESPPLQQCTMSHRTWAPEAQSVLWALPLQDWEWESVGPMPLCMFCWYPLKDTKPIPNGWSPCWWSLTNVSFNLCQYCQHQPQSLHAPEDGQGEGREGGLGEHHRDEHHFSGAQITMRIYKGRLRSHQGRTSRRSGFETINHLLRLLGTHSLKSSVGDPVRPRPSTMETRQLPTHGPNQQEMAQEESQLQHPFHRATKENHFKMSSKETTKPHFLPRLCRQPGLPKSAS